MLYVLAECFPNAAIGVFVIHCVLRKYSPAFAGTLFTNIHDFVVALTIASGVAGALFAAGISLEYAARILGLGAASKSALPAR